ncbi:MAG: CAP domain-containing protein [Thermoanaerobaculia bacterium]
MTLAVVLAGATAFAGFPLAVDDKTATAFLAAVNAERAHHGLAPVRLSQPLRTLAAERAEEIGASDSLDFEPMSSGEALARARALGYPAVVAQELVAVQEGDPCAIIEDWSRALGSAEAFLRHEAKDIGVGEGVLGEQPVRVLIAGVPQSPDPLKKRLPGVAPREWLAADLYDLANRKRNEAGYPSFDRSEALDTQAQLLAESLLDDARVEGAGVRACRGGGTILYFKATGRWNVADVRLPVNAWLRGQRETALLPRKGFAGAGVASRGADETLETVWTLAVQPGP